MAELPAPDGAAAPLYGPSWYKIDAKTLAELCTLAPHQPALAAALAWAQIAAIVWLWGRIPYPWNLAAYPVAAFFLAGRAGVFLQLAHEAAHGLVSEGPLNDWFGRWMACAPIGLDFEGYKAPHLRHHACANQPCDPPSDSEKYRVVDARDPALRRLFLKDILGITTLAIRLMYDRPEADRRSGRSGILGAYGSIAAVQLLVLGLLFRFDAVAYFALWILPLLTAHMVLMRVRGIAEHGLGLQLGAAGLDRENRGAYYTRSLGTPHNRYAFAPFAWVERALIGSLNVNFHHEHHLYPKVPYYHLPRLHSLVAERVARNNPHVYARGYFECVFFNSRKAAASPDRAPASL